MFVSFRVIFRMYGFVCVIQSRVRRAGDARLTVRTRRRRRRRDLRSLNLLYIH